jgi:cell division protein FtsW
MKLTITTLVSCAAALLSLGVVILWSWGIVTGDGHEVQRQLIWGGLGLGLAVVAAAIDYRWWKRLSPVIYVIALGLLLAVLFSPYGVTRNGATRWLEIGGMTCQPSEFAKLAMVALMAFYAERNLDRIRTFRGGILAPGILLAPVLVLVFRQPDWGTTILLAAVGGVMLMVAGVRWRHVMPWALIAMLALGAMLWQNDTRRARILGWMDLESTKQGVGMQQYQAMLSLGSGGIEGAGLGNGVQYTYVPENQTDFIYAVLGEELGLVGTMGVVVAFALFVICGAAIAFRARDPFGTLLAAGITFLIGLQSFINIGVVTNTLPNKGLPLPFISRGGSNLFLMLVCVGLLISVARRAARPQPIGGSVSDCEVDPSLQPC